MKIVKNNNLSLKDYEKIISKGFETFMEVGNALIAIKEAKLYMDDGYSTYADYCKKRWNFTPQHANRLIGAAKVGKKIEEGKPNSLASMPKSESQARALQKSADPKADWEKTQMKTGKNQPTAKEIKATVNNADESAIEAEVIEDLPSAEECDTVSLDMLTEIIHSGHIMGKKTGRPQIAVNVDDDAVVRLKKLNTELKANNGQIVALSLILTEKVLEIKQKLGEK